jgi:hypothetical protein
MGHPSTATDALHGWTHILCAKRTVAVDWEICRDGLSDTRTLSREAMGLGAAGTLGPEGQAAFSYGRPSSATPTALADTEDGSAGLGGEARLLCTDGIDLLE